MMFFARHSEIQCREQSEHVCLDICHKQLYRIDEDDKNQGEY